MNMKISRLFSASGSFIRSYKKYVFGTFVSLVVATGVLVYSKTTSVSPESNTNQDSNQKTEVLGTSDQGDETEVSPTSIHTPEALSNNKKTDNVTPTSTPTLIKNNGGSEYPPTSNSNSSNTTPTPIYTDTVIVVEVTPTPLPPTTEPTPEPTQTSVPQPTPDCSGYAGIHCSTVNGIYYCTCIEPKKPGITCTIGVDCN